MAGADDTNAEEAHGELSLARIALAENDLQHAADHLAGALAYAPALPEAHELLAVLAVRGDDGGLALFHLGEQNFIGAVVAHAHLLAGRDPQRALTMLAQATAYDPGKPWADVSWVRALDVAGTDPQALVRVFSTVMRPLGDPAPEPIRAVNEVYLDLAERAVAAYPGHAMVLATAAGLGRRLGRTATAVAWGERAVDLEPNKLTMVWYAYALRADGRDEDGMRVLRDAYRRHPLELDLCADLAQWLVEAGRPGEALSLIEDAVRVDPGYDCVVHTLHRLRFEADGDAAHLIALADYVRDHPQTDHEHDDLARCCRGRTWLGGPAATTEAAIDVLAQVPASRYGELGRLTLSALEVPSALALVRRLCPNSTVEIGGEPPADMVAPLRPGPALWRYAGMVAFPAVEAPGPAAVALLREVVTPRWPDPVAAYDQALPLGRLPVADLLALLVHPPAAPAGGADLPVGWWERCAQVFACLGLLHSRELGGEHPGDTTAQRRLLTELAFGIEDWITEAALYALVVAAWLDSACREEVREVVGRRFLDAAQAAQDRAVTILGSLADLVLVTPAMIPEVAALARDVLKDAAGAAPPPPGIPRPRKRGLLGRLRR